MWIHYNSNFAKVLYLMSCNSTWYFDRRFIASVQISSGLASLQRYRYAHNCRYSFWGQNTSCKFWCQGKSGQLVIPDESFLLSIFALICMKQKSIRINIILFEKNHALLFILHISSWSWFCFNQIFTHWFQNTIFLVPKCK